MALMDRLSVLVLPIRGIQFLFSIIVLGLESYVIHWWSSVHHLASPSQFNFLLVTALWTILALAYLVVSQLRLEHYGQKFVIAGIEAITTLFWFAGFIAPAVFLSDRVCYGKVCNSAKTAAVFGAFNWVLFAVTTAMATTQILSNHTRTRGRTVPEMTAHATA